MGHPLPGCVIGIDAGGTKVKVALSDGGTILESTSFPTHAEQGAEQCFDRITGEVERLRELRPSVKAIGIASPGVVEPESRHTYLTWNIPGWDDLDVARRLENRFDLPIVIENDGNSAALGESWFGDHGRSFAFFAVGTGFGGGIILDERLWRGKAGAAGEPGKWLMSLEAATQRFNYGHLESLVSGWGFETRYRELTGSVTSAKNIFALMEAGNGTAREIVEAGALALAVASANVSNLLDLDAIVLGGGVIMGAPDYWISRVEKLVSERCIYPPTVHASVLGEDAVLMGAIVQAHSRTLGGISQ